MSTQPKREVAVLDLQRRPMARAQRVPLIEREVREKIGEAALEVIFAEADRLSEGRVHQGRYFGSTMITINLPALGSLLRVDDGRRLDAIAVLFAEDARITKRIQRLAEREATARANVPLANVSVEVRVRTDGNQIFIDADVEATLRDA